MTSLDRWRWLAVGAGAAVILWTFIMAITGVAVSFTVAGVRVTSRDPFRALVTGAFITSVGLATLRFKSPGERWFAWCAAAGAIAVFMLGVSYGAWFAGGADAYGYVSQADLWTHGSVLVQTPLASEATWPYAEWALTPLGYRPAGEPGLMAPVYPIGLPLTMAGMKLLAGERGVFLVVPLLGALLVWLTFVLGRALDNAAAGLLAAVTMLFSPSFLFQLMMPMSDVPAAAWWLCAAVLALKPQSRWRLVASGLAAAMALLTRPNLVLVALPLAVLVTRGSRDVRERMTRIVFWGIPLSAAAIGTMVLNTALYGSPLRWGYGALDTLYSPRYTWTNLSQFTAWIVATQTPFILLGVFARSWLARWCLAFAAAVLVSYLWYMPFDTWNYVRFLLPAYPMLLATASAALVALARRYNCPTGAVLAAGLLVACLELTNARPAFTLASSESRYVAASEFAEHLPEEAVIVANLHSGSLRYYAHRNTLRLEWVGANEYNAALQTLRAHGHRIYAMLDAEEVEGFRQKYRGVTDVSWLDRPIASVGSRVFLYDVP